MDKQNLTIDNLDEYTKPKLEEYQEFAKNHPEELTSVGACFISTCTIRK